MKILLLTICIHTTILCNGQIDKKIYGPYKVTADSIVSLYLGQETFDKFVRLDSGQSEFLVLRNHWDNKAKFKEDLNFNPNVFEFNYSLNHPALLGLSFRISFMLDSSRLLMTGFEPRGLINLTTTKEDFKIISKKQAIEICQKKKIKNPINEFKVELGWYEDEGDYQEFERTKDLRDIVKGRIVWNVESKFREKPKAYDEKPYAEIFIIDAFTGEYLATESPYIDWD